MNKQSVRKLPADVFDTLDLVAYVNGGVGAGTDFRFEGCDSVPTPYCIHGLATECAADTEEYFDYDTLVHAALWGADIGRGANDDAVRAINARKRVHPHARVDFITEWCPELNVVRGE